MSIKQWFRNWMLNDDSESVKANRVSEPGLLLKGSAQDHIESESAQLSFAIIRAANGRIIKASTYKPQSRGPDWHHELYIVKDDEKIPDVIARIMAIKALES
jgi:hypothetical protein